MNNEYADQSKTGLATTDPTHPKPKESHAPKESMGNSITLGMIAVVAALISYFVIRQTNRVFELPSELLDIKVSEGRNQSPEVMKRFYDGLTELNYKHAALWIGSAGSIVGLLFGVTLGIMRRSRTSVVTGALGGLILGCALSACAGLVANCLGENVIARVRSEKNDVPVQYAMLLHGATWLVVGLGIGLGTGLGATKKRFSFAIGSMFMGGIAGAAAGAFYPFVASVAMPFVDPSLTIPEGDLNRLVWLGLPIVFIGLTLGRRS